MTEITYDPIHHRHANSSKKKHVKERKHRDDTQSGASHPPPPPPLPPPPLPPVPSDNLKTEVRTRSRSENKRKKRSKQRKKGEKTPPQHHERIHVDPNSDLTADSSRMVSPLPDTSERSPRKRSSASTESAVASKSKKQEKVSKSKGNKPESTRHQKRSKPPRELSPNRKTRGGELYNISNSNYSMESSSQNKTCDQSKSTASSTKAKKHASSPSKPKRPKSARSGVSSSTKKSKSKSRRQSDASQQTAELTCSTNGSFNRLDSARKLSSKEKKPKAIAERPSTVQALDSVRADIARRDKKSDSGKNPSTKSVKPKRTTRKSHTKNTKARPTQTTKDSGDVEIGLTEMVSHPVAKRMQRKESPRLRHMTFIGSVALTEETDGCEQDEEIHGSAMRNPTLPKKDISNGQNCTFDGGRTKETWGLDSPTAERQKIPKYSKAKTASLFNFGDSPSMPGMPHRQPSLSSSSASLFSSWLGFHRENKKSPSLSSALSECSKQYLSNSSSFAIDGNDDAFCWAASNHTLPAQKERELVSKTPWYLNKTRSSKRIDKTEKDRDGSSRAMELVFFDLDLPVVGVRKCGS